MVAMIENGEREKFNRDMRLATKVPSLGRTLTWRGRPYEHSDWFELYRAVLQYRIDADVASRITTPLLVTSPDNEQFWPGQSQQLAELVAGTEIVRFTTAEGADHHCQPLGRRLTENRIFDWLDTHVAAPATRRRSDPSSDDQP
jgi:hypothetical protein